MYCTGYDDGDLYTEGITAVTIAAAAADADAVKELASNHEAQASPSGRPSSKKRHYPIED